MEPQPYIASRCVAVDGTDIRWTGLGPWLDRVDELGGLLRPATTHYARCRRLYDSLEDGDVARTFDIVALRRAETLFDRERFAARPLFHGPWREWSRAELARRLQLIRARLAAIALGRGVRARAKGPRLDPT